METVVTIPIRDFYCSRRVTLIYLPNCHAGDIDSGEMWEWGVITIAIGFYLWL